MPPRERKGQRLYLIDVNNFQTWIDSPENVDPMVLVDSSRVPDNRWPVDSHREWDMWINGEHVVRWWFEDIPTGGK